jgi:hypothetical protein
MTFSHPFRTSLALAGATLAAFVLLGSASAMIPDRGHRGTTQDAAAVEYHTYGVGAGPADMQPLFEWHSPGGTALLLDGLNLPGALPDSRAVHGPAAVDPVGAISRPAPADNVAAEPAFPPLSEITKFSFVPGRPSVGEYEAEGWKRIAPPTTLLQYSVDGPRTAPDSIVRPVAQTPANEPVAQPGFDWTDTGIGIALGALAGLMLGAALLMGRRRGTLAGA